MENNIFIAQLQNSLNKKSEWFDSVRLLELKENYGVLLGCTKNLNEVFVKKTIVIPDPYRTDKQINELFVPDTSDFTEKEQSSVFGNRFADYLEMLEFLSSGFRYLISDFTEQRIQILNDFSNCFRWDNLDGMESKLTNTKALANVIEEAKNNTPEVIISMINDCVSRNAAALYKINTILKEIAGFQKELYKWNVREKIIANPEFNTNIAYSSQEDEMGEIKRLYSKCMGKTQFYTELIKEIIQEDQNYNKDEVQTILLRKLEITTKEKKVESVSHDMLMNTVLAISALAPTLNQLKTKCMLNLDLIFSEKKSFISSLKIFIRKLFGLKPPARICALQFSDTGRVENLNADDFLVLLGAKIKLFNVISTKGSEYGKLDTSSDDTILQFIDNQITECQDLYTQFNSFDDYFKRTVDVSLVSKIKGTQIERTALRNTLVNVNKKRADCGESLEQQKNK